MAITMRVMRDTDLVTQESYDDFIEECTNQIPGCCWDDEVAVESIIVDYLRASPLQHKRWCHDRRAEKGGSSTTSHVAITTTCENGHVMATYTDIVAEKYPLWCGQCDDTMSGKYPFTITTQIIDTTKPGE